jgi:predicted dehydrogenase
MKGLLVGFGSIGRRHLTNLHQLGVSDWSVVHTGRGTLPLEPPCPVRTYSDLSEALAEDRPTFAVIANPTSLHVPTAVACARAGCHVLLEKPISHNSDGVDELASVRAALGVGILVGFQFRFDPGLHRIRELLSSGTFGRPLHARVIWAEHLPSWHPWEDWRSSYAARPDLGGGAHHTICHPYDYLRMLFGDPIALSASLADDGPLGLPVPEAADVTLAFDEGPTVQLHLDYWGRPPTHQMQVVCEDGTIEWDYIKGSLATWDAGEGTWHSYVVPGVEHRNDLFLHEARDFIRMIAEGEPPACTLEDGIATLRICEAIDRAAASRSRIDLDGLDIDLRPARGHVEVGGLG